VVERDEFMVEIVCPKCGHVFKYKRPYGKGTHYSKRIKRVGKMGMMIVKWWFQEHQNDWLPRSIAYHKFQEYIRSNQMLFNSFEIERAKSYTMEGFMGRMSELLGLGVFLITKRSKKPRYKICVDKAESLIQNNGKVVW